MKRHTGLVLSGILLGMLTFLYLSYNEPVNFPDHKVAVLFAVVTGVMVIYDIHMVSLQLNRLVSWRERSGYWLLAGMVANFTTGFFITVIMVYAYVWLHSDEVVVPNQLLIKLAIIIFIGVLIYSIAHFAYQSYAHYQFVQVQSVKQETRQIDLQLRALKAQLSPHFLFNSLNTISSLMYKDEKAAEDYIRSLAKSYQYTLPGYEQKWVTFSEEAEYLKAWHHLLSTRFADQLQLVIENEEDLADIKLPPLTLQMLVENAIKHNLIGGDQKLTIKVYADKKWLIVSNNKTRSPENVQSFKIGLDNIKERYELLFGKSIEVIDTEWFTVKLPRR